MAQQPHVYWIDVSGTCNLRCPSCPTGNYDTGGYGSAKPPIGFMDEALFDEILARIRHDAGGGRARIEFYNWGEPLLHPQIHEFVGKVRAIEGFHAGISTNLSVETDLRKIVRAQPTTFRISLSGYFQQNYGVTHARGDIDLVKSNMYRLRHYMNEYDISFSVTVAYHCYKGNVFEDLERMKQLCDELDFKITPNFARFNPLEKVFAHIRGELPEADRKFVENIIVPLDVLREIGERHKDVECILQTGQTAINYDGSVQLCCGTYEAGNRIAASFLEQSREELLKRRQRHETCSYCIAHGIHALAQYSGAEELNETGNGMLREMGSPFRIRVGQELRRADDGEESVPATADETV